MARIVGTSFNGVSPYEADVSAPTWRRVYRHIIEDLALLYDRITGQNSPANPIDHSGNGNGARMGVPIVNEWLGRSVVINGVGGPKDGGADQRGVVLRPIFIPAGETSLVVRLKASPDNGSGIGPFVVTILDETGAQIATAPMTPLQGSLHARLSAVTAGRRILIIEAQLQTGTTGDVRLGGLFVGPARGPWPTGDLVTVDRTGVGTNTIGIYTPSSSQALRWTDYDDAEISADNTTDGMPLSARITALVNRNINGLFEFLTAAPPTGNTSYTQVDHDGSGSPDSINPARSRFSASTRSLLANEPLVQMPIMGEVFGVFDWRSGYVGIDARPPAEGALDFYGIIPTVTTTQTVVEASFLAPDFPAGGGSSNLKCDVLVGSDSGAPANWTMVAATDIDSDVVAVPAALASASKLRLLTFDLDFSPDVENTFSLSISRSGSLGALDELVVLGYALYFDW